MIDPKKMMDEFECLDKMRLDVVRQRSALFEAIDRLEKYSHKTVHAPNYVLVLKSDLDSLIRERKCCASDG
jgi:hypothetical protein